MKKLLYIFAQWTWGIPQNLAGLFVYLFQKHEYQGRPYRMASVTYWNHRDSLSLGMFLFIGKHRGLRTIKHEYGHSIQSIILGPFYLIVVGIPSILWCHLPGLSKKWKRGEVSYFSRFPENWADRLGEVTAEDTDECTEKR
ncbi:MAG: hypothetical protein Q4E54_02510 [Lachnospiraceae bacterium]|nr:hypothetical protein [Lachnospiraceae bacterium]